MLILHGRGLFLIYSCGKLDYKIHIVGLNLSLVGGLVSHYLAALFTAVNYYITAFGVGKRSYRAQNSAARICSVPGVYINVKRREAKRAVISRGISERKNLATAAFAYKSVIVFGKSFVFHGTTFQRRI